MITLIMMLPVIAFLMWLYWYTRPADLPARLKTLDNAIMISAPVTSLVTGWIVFWYLPGEGIWPHVMAALLAYLALIGELGAGWVIRLVGRGKG